MPKTYLPAALAVALGLFAPAAAAGNSLFDMVSKSGIEPGDYSVMETQGRQLYDPLQPVGTERRWSNPDTGSQGRVLLRGVRGDCAELMHVLRPRGAARDINYRVRRCRGADGQWRLDARPN